MNKKANKRKKKRGKNASADETDVNRRPDVRRHDSDNVDSKRDDNVDDGGDSTRRHASSDLCYEIRTSDVMGRYLVASKPISPGQVIIQEPALAVGPCAGCPIICLGCYHELDPDSIYKCAGCKWPACGDSCPGRGKNTGHSDAECRTLKELPPNYQDLEDLKDCYHALMPLRCLLLKTDPEKWQTLTKMESHNEMRKARGDIWPQNQELVVDRIVKKWRLPYDEHLVHTICGILEVNAFEVGGAGRNARALYDRAYLLAHDCTPSTTHTDAEAVGGRPLTIRAAVAHSPGDLISLCYAYTLQGTLKRREHIIHSKFFACECKRCKDPTELGTYASAFSCPKCGGSVLSLNPLDEDANWSCVNSDCVGYTMTASAVKLLLKRLTEEYDQIDVNDVPGFESFLHKYRNVIQSSHYLCLSAKHSLSQLYGKIDSYMIQDMPETELKRKIEICNDLMKVFDVLEPGYSRLRGVTLYELHAPLMILTTRDFEKKAISKDVLRIRLKEVVNCLRESALILGFEPSQSAEGLMASAAREALARIRTWEKIIGHI